MTCALLCHLHDVVEIRPGTELDIIPDEQPIRTGTLTRLGKHEGLVALLSNPSNLNESHGA